MPNEIKGFKLTIVNGDANIDYQDKKYVHTPHAKPVIYIRRSRMAQILFWVRFRDVKRKKRKKRAVDY